MTEHSNGVVILITLLNILVYKLQKLQEAQQKKRLPLAIRQLCRRFSLHDIRSATNNFKEELVIGKGGFGIVYRGIIDFKEKIVAIKRAKALSKQGSKEFLTEIKMLSQFQHSHLVSLIGYCDDYEEMILVYDHMPSGTLADHLHKRVRKGDTSFPSLSWVQRLKICLGAAQGLDYLHTGTGIEDRVIHRDVKTANILLDENLAAKISDFGLSKTGPANQTCTYVSTRVKGTPGYLDPYYVATHRLTRKTDVYAFGVVLFEVLCGRPAVNTSLPEEQISLAGWAQHCYEAGLLEQIIDPYIKADISSDSLNMYVDLAIKCLHSQPKLRPTMAEVLVVLESALALQEKSTYYSLVEIVPSEYNTEEDVDSSTLNIRKTYNNHEHESAGEAIVNNSDDWHHNKQYSARMTFTKRVSVLLSVTARAWSGNRDAKTSRYRTGVLSVNRNKLQGTNTRTFLPVDPAVPPPSRGEKEYLQSLKLNNFKFNDLKKATSKFRPDSVIGKGGFGYVYKGWIDENTFAAAKWGTGLAIAVKRLNVEGFQGHREWSAEINYLGTLTHPNLIKLIGYCLDHKHRLLVYEFMPQGSLDQHLFRSSKDNQLVLDWPTRFKICIGIARGLAFLHEESRLKIVHRDIKATNVLLDRDLNPKISDFGLAKLNDEDESHISTRIAGTIGYMAPEYAMRGYLTNKADVYSFGVVALEIVSGKSNNYKPPSENGFFLLDWAWNLQKSKKFEELVDESLGSEVDNEESVRMVKVALLCTKMTPSTRPIMSEVVSMLEGQLPIPDTTPETYTNTMI